MVSDKLSLVKNSLKVSAMDVAVILSGFGYDALIVAFFGLKSNTDAFFVAYTIPFIFINIMSIQASKVILPLYINLKEAHGNDKSSDFLSASLTFNLSFGIALALFGLLISHIVVAMQVPGANEEVKRLAISLSSILFTLPAFYGTLMLLNIVQMAHGKFAIVTSLKCVENLSKMAFILLLFRSSGIFCLAYGLICGALLEIVIVIWSIRKFDFRYRMSNPWKNSNWRKACRLSVNSVIGHGATQAVQIVINVMASYLPQGSISSLRYATRIVESAAGALSGGVVMVILPMVSRNMALNQLDIMKGNIRHALLLLAFMTIPFSVWLASMSTPLISLFFERGAFTGEDTIQVARILLPMIPYIFLSRYLGVVEAAFLGKQDTRTPLINMLALSFLNTLFVVLLFGKFGILSFPFARLLSYCCSCILISWFLFRTFGNIWARRDLMKVVYILASSAVMWIFLSLGQGFFVGSVGSSAVGKGIEIASGTALGGAAFITACFITGLIDFAGIQSLFRRGRPGTHVFRAE
jgi:putative peptidoglycan lipid II flippase